MPRRGIRPSRCGVDGSPRAAVQLVQGDRAGLEVGADAQLLGGPYEDVHLSGAAGLERAGHVGVVASLVDEPDLIG